MFKYESTEALQLFLWWYCRHCEDSRQQVIEINHSVFSLYKTMESTNQRKSIEMKANGTQTMTTRMPQKGDSNENQSKRTFVNWLIMIGCSNI